MLLDTSINPESSKKYFIPIVEKHSYKSEQAELQLNQLNETWLNLKNSLTLPLIYKIDAHSLLIVASVGNYVTKYTK